MPQQTKKYRIPAAPIGMPYYRRGTLYEPGAIVLLPEDEVPPGWVRLKDGTMRPSAKHAWKEIVPGVKERDDEKESALEAARNKAAELMKEAEEQQRLLVELEAKASDEDGENPRRRVVQERDDEQLVAPPFDPDVDRGPGDGLKGKAGRRRAADADL